MKRDAGSRDKGWNRGHPRKERGHRAIREGNKTMSRVYNFSAGPAVLPEEVLKEAAAEMLDYNGTGMSVMEMSHRSKAFEEIIQTCLLYTSNMDYFNLSSVIRFFELGITTELGLFLVEFGFPADTIRALENKYPSIGKIDVYKRQEHGRSPSG